MRVDGGVAQLLGKPLRELGRYGVLEAIRFRVNSIKRVPEELREVQLDQPVEANHLEGQSLALVGELDAVVGSVLDEPQLDELPDHAGNRRWPDSQLLGDGGVCRRLVPTLKLVDRFQVVLDCSRAHFGSPQPKLRLA